MTSRLGPTGNRGALWLTCRERDVLALLCYRLTDAEIADCLSISKRTEQTHVASILRKLDARNRRDAVAVAASLGLVSDPMARWRAGRGAAFIDSASTMNKSDRAPPAKL